MQGGEPRGHVLHMGLALASAGNACSRYVADIWQRRMAHCLSIDSWTSPRSLASQSLIACSSAHDTLN